MSSGVEMVELMWLIACLVQGVTGVTTVDSRGLIGTMVFV